MAASKTSVKFAKGTENRKSGALTGGSVTMEGVSSPNVGNTACGVGIHSDTPENRFPVSKRIVRRCLKQRRTSLAIGTVITLSHSL